jgi:hypothetical protein
MPIKKELSKSVVFASVFAGTLISEGISLVTISDPGKKLAEKVGHTIKDLQTDIQEQIHIITARLIEESALINLRFKRGEVGTLLQVAKNSFKSSFDNAKAKYAKRV